MNSSYENFINAPCFVPPGYHIVYSPTSYCGFSPTGEQMVETLIEASPLFHNTFNKLVPLEDQSKFAVDCFAECRKEWDANKRKLELEEAENPLLGANRKLLESIDKKIQVEDNGFDTPPEPPKRVGKKYFETNRKFSYLTPAIYKRTAAPRISAVGSTFHGMKKDLSRRIFNKMVTHMHQGGRLISIVDVDMSAAHARFAITLQGNRQTQLYYAVTQSGKFWDEKAAFYHSKIAEKGIALDQKQVRAMLKVSLYTSLNGGNPFGVTRLLKNISDQNPALTREFTSEVEFEKSDLYQSLKMILETFDLIAEVKALNKQCVTEDGKKTWTLDRQKPYYVDSVHKGISRALQGYEILLLSVLVHAIVKRGGLPINLAHDGSTIIIPGIVDEVKLCADLSNDIATWSEQILCGQTLPVEPKFNINSKTLNL